MNELTTDENGNMILQNSDANYLKDKYSVSDEFLNDLTAVIADVNAKGLTRELSNDDFVTSGVADFSKGIPENTVSPTATVENWKIYFTHGEVRMYFFAAAAAGPVAMAGALDAVAFLLGGPVGGTIAVILTVIGTATLVNICYLVLQAEVKKKGIYIGVTWNGLFPDYTQGLS